MISSTINFKIEQDPPKRLDKALFRDVPEDALLSRTRLARLIEAGMVEVGGRIETNVKAKVLSGDLITIKLKMATKIETLPENIPLHVVYEDCDLIVVNKPAGMVVHPAPGSAYGTLVNALLFHCQDTLSGIGGEKRPGIVHRIDKDTSGLLVVAKNDYAHRLLADQFAEHSVERLYLALCYGVPDVSSPRLVGLPGVNFEAGEVIEIRTQLGRHKHDRQRQAVLFQRGRHAVTRLKVIRRLGEPAGLAILNCWLETGRTHQIRAHLAHIGHGIIGDPVYGRARKIAKKSIAAEALEAVNSFSRQALHACVLGFTHPRSGKRLRFEVAPADDMASLMQLLEQKST